MSAPALSIQVAADAAAQARALPDHAAVAVTFDPTVESRTWIHGRLYRGGFYTVWAVAGKALRRASRPLMRACGRQPLRLPAFWDLKGTYTGSRALCRMNPEFASANDFLFPAPKGFSLADDPEESEYFCRPLFNRQQATKDETDAALFNLIEKEEEQRGLKGITDGTAAAPTTDCGRRAWLLLTQLERRVHVLEEHESARRLRAEEKRGVEQGLGQAQGQEKASREERADTHDEPTAHVRGAASP